MTFHDYKLPQSVRKVVCKKAGMPYETAIVLHDRYDSSYASSDPKYRGKPITIEHGNGWQHVVAVYIPWLASKGDLVRMLWQDEMDAQSFQRARLHETPPAIVNATARIEIAEFLLTTFPKHHARFQQLLDDATELEATARLIEAAYGRPERRTIIDKRSFS